MELRVITKQGGDFSLFAPDEPEAREAFEKVHPDHVTTRKRLIDKAAKENLFAEQDDEEEGDRDGEVDGETDENCD
jgi:hypothetical protein